MRRIVYAGVCVLLLALLALAAWRVAGPGRFERERAFVESELSSALKRPVRIGGSFALQLLPRPGFQASEVSVDNLPGRPSPFLAQIGELELRFHSWRLLLGDLEIAELVLRDAELRLEADPEGRFALESSVDDLVDDEATGPAPLRVRRFVGERVRIFVHAGGDARVQDLALESVSFEAPSTDSPVHLVADGTVDGEPFRFSASGGSLRGLRDASQPYPVSLRGRFGQVDLRVEGEMQAPLELEGVRLDFEAATAEAAALLPARVRRPGPLGPLEARGRVVRREGVVSLESLAVATPAGGAVELEVEGSIGRLRSLQEVDLRLRLALHDPAVLQPLVDHPLPGEGRFELSARVSDAEGRLGADLELHLDAERDAVALDLAGRDEDLRDALDPDLTGVLRSASLGALARLLGVEAPLPELAPLEARARLHVHDGTLALADAFVRAGTRGSAWVELRGSVNDVLAWTGVEVGADFGAADLQPLRPYLSGEPPDVGPVRGEARLSDRDGALGVERFELRGGREGLFRIDVAGSFDDVRAVDEIVLRLDVEGQDLTVLGALLAVDLPPVGPFAFAGRVSGSNEKLSADGALRLGESRFHGQAAASFGPDQRPRVTAALVSDHVQLADVGLAPEYAPLERGERRVEELRASPWWMGQEPLPFHHLRAVDGAILVQVQRASGRRELEVQSILLRTRRPPETSTSPSTSRVQASARSSCGRRCGARRGLGCWRGRWPPARRADSSSTWSARRCLRCAGAASRRSAASAPSGCSTPVWPGSRTS
jgi:hypothetical protein